MVYLRKKRWRRHSRSLIDNACATTAADTSKGTNKRTLESMMTHDQANVAMIGNQQCLLQRKSGGSPC
jgi:hypothetical protein